MRFLDVFSGIGGFRAGLEKAGHECIGHIERDKYAVKSYTAIYDIKENEYVKGDITEIEDFRELKGKLDLLVGGFPCQSFSIAGNRKGFDDIRGTMFFYLAEILKQAEPPFFLFENVKGLLSHDEGKTFETILNTLDELGYDCEWQVLNSKDFGVPQSRERVYITGYSRKHGGRKIFPIGKADFKDYGDEYTTTITTRYRGCGGETYIKSQEKIKQIGKVKNAKRPSLARYRVFDETGITPTIDTAQGGGLVPHIVVDNSKKVKVPQGYKVCNVNGISTTLKATASGVTQYGAIKTNTRVRRLTPRECWRLQGYTDEMFDKARDAGMSDTQLYKQAGNAVTVNVVYAIGRELKETERMFLKGEKE